MAAVQGMPMQQFGQPYDVESQQFIGSQHPSNTLLKDATKDVRMGFVRKVYGILSVQLILTVMIAAFMQTFSLAQLQTQSWLLGLSVFVTLGTVCAMSLCRQMTRTYPTNYAILFTFTVAEAILLGFASAAYTWQSVLLCTGLTAVIFLALSIFAMQSNTDFTGLGIYLYGALLSLLFWGFAMSLMMAFGVKMVWLIMLYDLIGVVTFIFYIIYDTQMIIGGSHKSCQFGIDDYVFAALNIYLDIIQLFLHLLRLMGKRK